MSRTKHRKKRYPWPIFLTAAVLFASGALIFWQNRTGAGPTAPVFETITPLPEHSYDWSLLTTDELGRKQYTSPETGRAKVGIDVSAHQGEIDWAAVAQDGVEFAFIRVGSRGYESGEIYPDARFAENLSGAAAAGIPVGVYFYSQATTEQEAREEADFILKAVREYPLSLPVVLDYEEVLHDSSRTLELTGTQRTDNAIAFCEQVRQAGYQPMVYSTRSLLLDHFDLARLEQYPIWVADYNESTKFPYEFSVWQYTSRGRVAGIGPDVDLNLMFR